MSVGLITHAVAAVAFAGLAVLLAVGWKRGHLGGWLLTATLLTMFWAAAAAIGNVESGWGLCVRLAETLRSSAWLGFLVVVLALPFRREALTTPVGWLGPIIVLVCILQLAIDLFSPDIPLHVYYGGRPDVSLIGRVVLAIISLLLLENLYRNSSPERRWSIKFFCAGLGSLFLYDFFLYSEALLYRRIDSQLFDARGAVSTIMVPLIAVSAARNPDWSFDVFVSRRAILRTTTLIGAGVYLLFMGVAGYYMRTIGGDWGEVLLVTFLFVAGLGLFLTLISGRFRAGLKVKINKHFFTYKYDYRDEWLRFISTIAPADAGFDLPQRVVQGVADIVESPEGALWLRSSATRFSLACGWNTSAWGLSDSEKTVEFDPDFYHFMIERQWVVNLDEYASHPELYETLPLPAFIAENRRTWLIVPLLHLEELHGILILGQPRAPKDLNWEDYDLLKTAGRQAASYVAERESARALVQARQFEEFNRRFAFVMHDLKNLVSQLNLMVENADRHKNNPAFLEDMVQTVKESVDKMNRLLVRLHQGGREANASAAVPLAALLKDAVDRAKVGRDIAFDCQADGLAVVTDGDRLAAAMSHLIDNALEATSDDGNVLVRLSARGADAVIEVEDDGVGMSPEFVRDELFKPFQTTKEGGYGIGAYESREIVVEAGGRLDVVSRPGIGTSVRISLPALHMEFVPADDGTATQSQA